MNTQKHKWIFYLITATILTTIAVQFYWNYINYKQNKQRVLNEIQLSLDNAIEAYYTNLSQKNFFAIVDSDNFNERTNYKRKKIWKNIFESTGLKKQNTIVPKRDSVSFEITSISVTSDDKEFKELDSTFLQSIVSLRDNKNLNSISDIKSTPFKDFDTQIKMNTNDGLKLFKGKKATDSLKLIKGLQTVFIAIQNDTINYNEVDSILTKELHNKGIKTDFFFNHVKADTLFFSDTHFKSDGLMVIESNSAFLKPDENFKLFYNNPNAEALKRSSTGIILSLLLSLIIIFSLFYLLKIINQQKQLAEIKNDLISNITHEFKTPISTVSTAIEAIENFNVIDDKEKTKKYLSMSSVQLKKLHLMVEKLLETATLDSEQLLLKKENCDIVELIDKLARKHQHLTTEKTIQLSTNKNPIHVNIDTFHFENAISNLIDNAVKYGGNEIVITISSILNFLEITITDNGNGIDKQQAEKIFDKFYRIPKGNIHDVKGFGIGLYYTKKIIEKHDGVIQLVSTNNNTVFKITIPNE